ncbi:hypothetical protein FO519_004207 [Halicephalobus sp. NKZ332]|nr:hypothetical protein FO519_004207 [Halicephalobus sp. NKZ332]
MKTSPTTGRTTASSPIRKKLRPSRATFPVDRCRSKESRVVESNPVDGVSSREVYYDCPICQSSLTAGTTCVTSCGHLFHKDCVKQWFTYERFCPYCRRENETPKDLDHDLDELDCTDEDYKKFSCFDVFRMNTVARIHRAWPVKEFRNMDPKPLFEQSQNAYFVAQNALQKGNLSYAYLSIRRAIHFNDGVLNTPRAVMFRRVHDMEYRHHQNKCNSILTSFEDALEKYYKTRDDLENSLCEKPGTAFEKMHFGQSTKGYFGETGKKRAKIAVDYGVAADTELRVKSFSLHTWEGLENSSAECTWILFRISWKADLIYEIIFRDISDRIYFSQFTRKVGLR